MVTDIYTCDMPGGSVLVLGYKIQCNRYGILYMSQALTLWGLVMYDYIFDWWIIDWCCGQITRYSLLDANPLFEQILSLCRLVSKGYTSMKFCLHFDILVPSKCIRKFNLRNVGHVFSTSICWASKRGTGQSARARALGYSISRSAHIEGILPKGSYLPCVSMAGRTLLAGYYRYLVWINKFTTGRNKLLC